MRLPRFLRSRRFWIGAAAALALLAVAAVPLWRWAFARAASDGRLERWVNRRPEKVRVEWEALRSPWPGWFEADGLRVVGHTPRVDWELRADRASGTLQLPALLARQVRLSGLRGAGVGFSLRRRPDAEAAARRDTGGGAGAGAAPEADATPAGEPAPAPPSPGGKPPWSFHFLDVELVDVRRLDLDGYLVAGTITAGGNLVLRNRKTAEVHGATLTLDDARVSAGDQLLARVESGRAAFEIDRWEYRGAGPEVMLPRLAGHVELRGELAPTELVSYLFGRASWLELEGGKAEVDARVEVDRGELVPGTRMRVVTAGQRLRLFGFESRGRAEIQAEVEAGLGAATLVAQLALTDWEMGRAGAEPIARGDELRLVVRRDEPRVDRSLADARVTVELGTATVGDLGFVNDYLPAATRLRVDGGSATLGGRLEVDTRERSGTGEIAIRAEDVVLVYGDDRLSGTVKIDLALSAPELDRRTFSLAGSRIRVDSFRVGPEADSGPGWWGAVDLPEGRLDLSLPLAADAKFRAHLADTSPIVAFYEARRDLPKWAEKLLTVESINVVGRAQIAPGELTLDDVLVPLSRGELRAWLRLERERRAGKLLLASRFLALGIGLEADRRDIRLRDAREWFERRAATGPEPQGAPKREGPEPRGPEPP